MLTSTVLALLLLAQAPAPGSRAVHLRADTAFVHPHAGLVEAEGHVRLQSGSLWMRAEHLTYDRTTGVVVASNATLVRGRTAAVADTVRVDLDTHRLTLTNGLLMKKKGASREALLEATSPKAMEALGVNTLVLRGKSVRQVGPDEYRVAHVSFTPCDCDALHPHWRIDAVSADVKAGDRVFLHWPVVYVQGVPVLASPLLDLPLVPRKTGLLIPRPSFTSSGFGLELPFFLTLGPSWDLTFTPGWFTGGEETYGTKGPRLTTALRWAPTAGLNGFASLMLQDDLRAERDVFSADALPGNPVRGLRGTLTAAQRQRLGHGWDDRVFLSLASDGFQLRDSDVDVIARANDYSRSVAVVDRRGEDAYLGAWALYRQDIRYGFSIGDVGQVATGGKASTEYGPHTLDELPSVLFAIPEHPLIGPLDGALDAEFTRTAPLFGRFGDEGPDGIYGRGSFADPGQGDRHFELGERESRDRLDLHPSLSAGFSLGRFARVVPTLALREDLYYGEVTGSSAQRGYLLADVRISSHLSKTFTGAHLTHAIEPSIELRYAPPVWGAAPSLYDDVDLALPSQGILQAQVEVSQDLFSSVGSSRLLAGLDLGERFDLLAAKPAQEPFARLRLGWGPVRLAGVAFYDWPHRRLSEVSASAGVSVTSIFSVFARWDDLATGGSASMRAGMDALLGPTLPVPLPKAMKGRARQLSFGGSVRLLGGLSASYAAIYRPEIKYPWAQQVFGISYAPACDCWRLGVSARFTPEKEKTFGRFSASATLTIAHFGTFGS